MRNNNKFALLHRLVCVPKCASCKKRISPTIDTDEFNHGIPCLCDECMKKWQTARVQINDGIKQPRRQTVHRT